MVTFRLKGESGWCSKYGTMLNQGKISSATGKTTKSVLEISTASSGWVRRELCASKIPEKIKQTIPPITGNILISALTNTVEDGEIGSTVKFELSIDIEDWSDNRRFARYRYLFYSIHKVVASNQNSGRHRVNCLAGKSLTPHWEDVVHFRSSKQFPLFGSWTFEGLFIWLSALQPWCVRCFRNLWQWTLSFRSVSVGKRS